MSQINSFYYCVTYIFDISDPSRPLLVITYVVFPVENDALVLFATKAGSKMGSQKVPARLASSDTHDAGQNEARLHAVNRQLHIIFRFDF